MLMTLPLLLHALNGNTDAATILETGARLQHYTNN